MSNCEYLLQAGSNHVFVSTPELVKMPDMTPYDFEKLGHPAKPKKAVAPKETPSNPIVEKPMIAKSKATPDEIIKNLADPGQESDANDKPGTNAVKTELEAIEDPGEMVAHVLEKYGLKLTRTMRKDTMIARTLDHIKD